MEILVCVKQVPDTAEVKIDPEKHTVIRAGVPNIFNPFDQNALEAALQLKDNQGARVTLLSMGPRLMKFCVKGWLWAPMMRISLQIERSAVPIRWRQVIVWHRL